MGEKALEQSNKIISYLNLNNALGVGRIIDYLINALDFQNKSEIAVSDILKK